MLGATFTVHASLLDSDDGQPSDLVLVLREASDPKAARP